MNVVMIIPTGIGCEIGGHAGDANPAAKLLGACCDKLILHPNVVNASDINEMPPNALYVEGSMLDRFLKGNIELKEVRQNRILVVVNEPIHNETINAVSAARATIGADIEILVLNHPLIMEAQFKDGIATGIVEGWQHLCNEVKKYEFDALAIATPITIERELVKNYWDFGGVNPWGGVEAMASRLISTELYKPVAHAPVERKFLKDLQPEEYDFVCDPRDAAEIISVSYLQCVLKGLHRAPRIGKGLSVDDIDVMVSPYGCWGRPHRACEKAGIPIIIIEENTTVLNDEYPDYGNLIVVENYLEAAGLLMAMQAGVSRDSLERPLKQTILAGINC